MRLKIILVAIHFLTFDLLVFACGAQATGAIPIGDTLTIIQRPLPNIPSIVRIGDTLRVDCQAPPGTTGWRVFLARNEMSYRLQVINPDYNCSTLMWNIAAFVDGVPADELYHLVVEAGGGLKDTTRHSVKVLSEFKREFYFIHITDTHLPTHYFYYQSGSERDSSEVIDLREVIKDINIINPEFILLTGDLVNEGELEDYLSRRYYSRGQRLLEEFDVPVYLTAGNHDIGGWKETPPPDGTARRNWWNFFGWKYLQNPPAGLSHTQDYSFNYGDVHFVGMEAYINYDGWLTGIYGGQSFTQEQLQWLTKDLSQARGMTRVLFYHRDFSQQISLSRLGVDMALSGHTHSDQSDFIYPYDIVTDNVCDGERCYRLIRVSNGQVVPTATISSGPDGANLMGTYTPANNGGSPTVTATVTNRFQQRFEHGLLKFVMPKLHGSPSVEGGVLLGIDESGPFAVWYVGVDILPASTMTVKAHIKVSPQYPSVTVISPNGGEIWLNGMTYPVVWAATDDQGVTEVDILLSTNGGISYEQAIAMAVANDGCFDWKIDAPTTNRARIKVVAHDADRLTGADVSDANFIIADPTRPAIFLSKPTGGEIWDIGSSGEIVWTSVGYSEPPLITISLSRNGGISFPEVLATDEVDDGSFVWEVTGEPTSTARVKITAHDSSGNLSSDVSLSEFVIRDPTPPEQPIPSKVVIDRVIPNPLSAKMHVRFAVPKAGYIDLALYDVNGRLVADFGSVRAQLGYNEIDVSLDRDIVAGIYILAARFEDHVAVYKLVRARNPRGRT